jgi:hypothetical protein
MKNLIFKYSAGLIIVIICFSSCKKKDDVNIFNMFSDVTVTYHANGPYAVTDYKEVNSGDSVYLDYTIESANKGMYAVNVFEAGAAIPFIKIPLNASQRKSYSNIVKLKMNSKVGRTSYRIWALDSAGVYMGDGYKTITIDVKANYKYWSSRNLYVPDTLGKSNKCYLSLTTGDTFSYTEGLANSAKIDLGYAFNGTHTIYALNASPLPFLPYDVSAFTKKATLFAAAKTNQGSAFLNLRTGEQIVSAAKSAKPTLKSVPSLAAGSLFYFQTAEGKYGAFYVNYVTQSNSTNGVFMNVDIKIEP